METNKPFYEFPQGEAYAGTIEDSNDNYIQDLYNDEGPFGESDCAGL